MNAAGAPIVDATIKKDIKGTLMAYLQAHMAPSDPDTRMRELRHGSAEVEYEITRTVPEAMQALLGTPAVVGHEKASIASGQIISTTTTPVGNLCVLHVRLEYTQGDEPLAPETRVRAYVDVEWKKKAPSGIVNQLITDTCRLWVTKELNYMDSL